MLAFRGTSSFFMTCLLAFGVGCSDDDEAAPPPEDCVMGDWTDWSECTEECDTGMQTRTRTIVTPASGGGAACGATEETQTCNEDPCLRLNHVQVIGSHNSYKIQPSDGLYDAIEVVYQNFCLDEEEPPNLLPVCDGVPNPEGLVYSHPPLADQFENQGIRQIELDVWVDRDGGKFADPFGPPTAGLLGYEIGPDFDPDDEMLEPGIKVFHVQDIDFRSQCLSWIKCLEALEDWSSSNPNHLPIIILVELKQGTIELPPEISVALGIAFVEPTLWEEQDLRQLQDDIRTVFHDTQIILPADVRADADTLYEAITNQGWPRISDVRGKVLFALDNGGSTMDLYRNDVYPDLMDRILFTSSPVGDPDSGFRKENDPFQGDIEELVADGFIVRTRADADTVEARTNDTSQRDRALESGAQYVSTDYREANLDFSDYSVSLPGDAVARCNPINAPPNCVSEALAP